jgi:hypothetical protein
MSAAFQDGLRSSFGRGVVEERIHGAAGRRRAKQEILCR